MQGWHNVQVFAWHRWQLCLSQGPAGVGSRRLVQDVHTVPHGSPSRPRVRPCAAAFHLSGSVLLGVQHFLLVSDPLCKQASVLQGEEAGVGCLS